MYVAFFGALSLSCHFPAKPSPPKPSHAPTPVGPTVLPLTIIDLTSREGQQKTFREHVSWSSQELAPFGIGVMVYRYVHEPMSGPVNVQGGDDPRFHSRLQRDGTVYVFVVDDIKLKGDPKNGFQSTHGDLPFIAIEKTAGQITWAHEIGHLLELDHDPSVENIMCSCDEARSDPHFTADQGEIMNREARKLVLAWWAD